MPRRGGRKGAESKEEGGKIECGASGRVGVVGNEGRDREREREGDGEGDWKGFVPGEIAREGNKGRKGLVLAATESDERADTDEAEEDG